ncbi:GyrI-like domain-containing protein [Cellulosimicrobium marinum]|uniref:GyrI-like domain-containing protein n=1 Tax=Cellulosimicrobium marinum TaxID=1638992 RepID=UPI001E5DAE22|nr:GyrI-like domain-containing protein [Cellulosimicrobium marinum]MCB7135258.1 GyrI-like domain-containing protein [Cellulosimicrobium marinum]
MEQTPQIQHRPDQPYVGVTRTVTMQTVPEIADRLPGVVGWLLAQGVEPAGPPFLRYLAVEMDSRLVVEAGVPVATTDGLPDGDGTADDPARPSPALGVLPGGRYAVVLHRGHPDGLERATGELLAWAAERGLTWDADAEQRRWGVRLESYRTDPREEHDMERWETELAFRLADPADGS